MKDRISAIILAAGLSSRMGRLKPLLPLGHTTILERVIALFQDIGIEDVRIVTGHRHEAVRDAAEKCNTGWVHNPDYREDMFSSVVTGIEALEAGTDATFILPVDIPLVRPSTVRSLLGAYNRRDGRVVYPVYEGKRGHPPLIPHGVLERITSWRGDGGLRAALSHAAPGAIHVDVADEYILFDVDTPGDYERLVRRADSVSSESSG